MKHFAKLNNAGINKNINKNLSINGMQILNAALQAVAADKAVSAAVRLEDRERLWIYDRFYDLSDYKSIFLLAIGKAAPAMAAELEKILGNRLENGLVVTKYDHGQKLKRCVTLEAAHPVPDQNSLFAGEKVLQFVRNRGQEINLLIILLSGGASSLVCLPAAGLTLTDLQDTTNLLLGCGADILEINIVRKHLSQIKGGLLLSANRFAQIVTLSVSDVVGDDPETIGSGLSYFDKSSFAQAMQLIKKYEIDQKLPRKVWEYISLGCAGKKQETIKPNHPMLKNTNYHIILSNHTALNAAKKKAEEIGYDVEIITTQESGDTDKCAFKYSELFSVWRKEKKFFNRSSNEFRPLCLLAGGECSVVLPPHPGKGGRNQQFILAMLYYMRDWEQDFWFASVGSDGTDGPTDAAGVWLDQNVIQQYSLISEESEWTWQRINDEKNAYPLFAKLGNLIITGPTNTNVMDLRIFLFH